MRIPDGRECKFFYGDYYRGRNIEECRGFSNGDKLKKEWTSDLCKTCPIPDILRNNACPNMTILAYIDKSWFRKRMKFTAYCFRSHQDVRNPIVGCGHCHELDSDSLH